LWIQTPKSTAATIALSCFQIKQLLPAICRIAGDTIVLQQDSATAHRASDTVAILARAVPQFTVPDLWPATSPDLNPVKCIKGQVKVQYFYIATLTRRPEPLYKVTACRYQTPMHDVDDLMRYLIAVWSGMQQTVIDEAIGR
jgi:hypothetical protein